MRRFILPLALAALVASPTLAQMAIPDPLHGAGAPADVAAGTYALEPTHTQVTFSVSHMGISPFAGTFSGGSGKLTIDPAKPTAATVSVTIPTTSIQTTSTKLTEELNSADWLDTARFPTATFKSTAVRAMGGGAEIDGMLTLHGVTKPVVLRARFFGAATNPMSKKASVGFLGRIAIKRADFGVTKYVPLVSDETVLVINAAFEKQ
ncbi:MULTISPECIES: YceI family protein [unclassified Sphingomonas]|uniref:YceI family protein n=1 Tax=unclassified Sphingomonas TaxID=196159 RepID=UPI001F56EE51|nr:MULTISPECIES: YceI family protein [unclassified Sphingomonas]